MRRVVGWRDAGGILTRTAWWACGVIKVRQAAHAVRVNAGVCRFGRMRWVWKVGVESFLLKAKCGICTWRL